jgi:hypothetical protein
MTTTTTATSVTATSATAATPTGTIGAAIPASHVFGWPTNPDWEREGFVTRQEIPHVGGAIAGRRDLLIILGASDDDLLVALSSTAVWARFWYPEYSGYGPNDRLSLEGVWLEPDRVLFMMAELRRRGFPSPLPWFYEGVQCVCSLKDLDRAAEILAEVEGGGRQACYNSLYFRRGDSSSN